MTEPEVSRSRLEPDERRAQILACATRLFGDRPYAAVSTTELASEAGVTRGLIHHYFGTKRGLYLEVVRAMVIVPDLFDAVPATGALATRVERSVDWFLDSVGTHRRTFVAVTGAEGVGGDPEVERILAEADDIAAQKVLDILGVGSGSAVHERERAVIRAYGSMVKGAVREWARDGALSRDDVRLLLVHSLLAIVEDVLPRVGASSSGTTTRA